jgi:hypothetical protein
MNDAMKHAPCPYLGCVLPFWLALVLVVASEGLWWPLGASGGRWGRLVAFGDFWASGDSGSFWGRLVASGNFWAAGDSGGLWGL